MKSSERVATRLMAGQHGLLTLEQGRSAGLTFKQMERRVADGLWLRFHPGVFGLAGVGRSPDTALLAACLAAGPMAAASHLSAAWILGLVDRPPARPAVVVPHGLRPRLRGVDVHHSRDLDVRRVLVRRGIPYTDGLRCLCDLAGHLHAEEFRRVMDRALATGTVTTAGLAQEARRRSRPGRTGPPQLRAALLERGLIGGPEPSVLEAETLKLFRRSGIPVQGREVRMGSDGRYRIDFLIRPGLVVEVDGFAYHWSPEAKAYDDARRNRLRLTGVMVLVYSWRDIRFDGPRVVSEIRSATR